MAYYNRSGNRENDEQDALVRELGSGSGDVGAAVQALAGGMRTPTEPDPIGPPMGTRQRETLDGGGAVNQTQPAGSGMALDLSPGPASGLSAPGTDIGSRKALGGYAGVGNMLGFNTALDYPDDKAANSMKNTFGRIASRYAATPNSIDAILADPDFQRFFPGAKKAGFDKIDFGGQLSDFESGTPVGVVDVGGAFDPTNNTGAGWTWQDLANDGGGGAGGGPMGGGGDPISMLLAGNQSQVDQLGNSDVLEQILKVLAEQGGPQV